MGVSDTKRSVRAPPSPPLQTGSGSSTLLNFFARLVAWYLLYTVLFRCPEVPTNDSPTICHTANTVSTTLRPHIEPYYIQYVEPYVSEYAPCVKKANEDYLVPVYDKAQTSYTQYAAPHVSSTRSYVLTEYNRAVKPRIDVISSKATIYYDQYLSPHVTKGAEYYMVAQPHITKVQKTIEEAYKNALIPAYEKALPHVLRVYGQAKHVFVTVVAPVVRQNGQKAVYWGIGIWSDVVRPQVGRIGERLGGTGNGTPAASVTSSLFSSLSATGASKSTVASSSLASIIASASAEAASAKLSASASLAAKAEAGSQNIEGDESKKLTAEEAATIIEEDLLRWENKFKESQVKTIADLHTQINKISTEAKTKKAPYVAKELSALEKLVEKEFNNIKQTTIKITSKLTPDFNAEQKQLALDSLFETTRDAGLNIRDKAQGQRLESQKYLALIYDDVAAAADDNLEIFDSVLDLSMQELGMKWAWMDHVSYKSWRRYHALKKEFESLKRDVVIAAQRNQKLIEITRWVEGDWEGKATDIARDAAEELTRLKRVSKKKIDLADSSNDFSDSILSIAKQAPEAQGTEPDGSKKAANARVPGGVNAGFVGASRVEYDQDFDDETVVEKVQSVIDVASEKLAYASRAVSEALAGATPTQAAGERYTSIVSEKYEAAINAASSALYPQPTGESLVGIATDKYSAAVAAASSVIYGTPTPKAELYASRASEAYNNAIVSVEDGYRKAMRNVVTMVYPDELLHKDSAKSSVEKAYSEALTAVEEKYSSIFKQASSAQHQYDHMIKQAQESYQSVVDAASTAIYGTPQPAVESVVSVAKEKYQQAVKEADKTYDSWYSAVSTAVSPPPTPTVVIISSQLAKKAEDVVSAASEVIYGTPQPFIESVASVAGEYASTVTDSAEERYESMKQFMSELISGKEPSYTESVMSRFSSLMYGTEAPIVAKATSAVIEAYDSASSAVAGNYESATSAIGSMVTPPPAVESILSAVDEQYQAAIMAASIQVYGTTQGTAESISSAVGEAYESAQSAISEAIYGRQIGAFESATLRMQEAAESAQSAISEAVYGTSKGTFESATSVIGEGYAAATDVVSEGLDAAGSAIGESYEQAQARISAAIYGPQQGIVESAQSRIAEAAESAKRSLSAAIYGTQARYAEQAASSVSSAASVMSSVDETVGSATEKVKEVYSTVRDEL